MAANIPFNFEYRDRVTGSAGQFKLRSYDCYRIYTLISGDGPFYYFIGDTLYEPRAGDVMIIRPGVLHGGYKKVRARYVRLYVTISPKLFEYLETIDRSMALFFTDGDLSIVSPAGEDAAEYMRLAAEMREISPPPKKGASVPLLAKLLAQLDIIYRSAGENREPPPPGGELLRRIITYINNDYAAISSVAEIASHFNYSTNYLSQYFKRHMNIGLVEFLNEKKLAEATALLLTGKSVTESALSCGFGSASYFISRFRKKNKTSPARYAKQFTVNAPDS